MPKAQCSKGCLRGSSNPGEAVCHWAKCHREKIHELGLGLLFRTTAISYRSGLVLKTQHASATGDTIKGFLVMADVLYIVKVAEGKVTRPMTGPQVLSLLRAGKLTKDQLVRPSDGKSWRPLQVVFRLNEPEVDDDEDESDFVNLEDPYDTRTPSTISPRRVSVFLGEGSVLNSRAVLVLVFRVVSIALSVIALLASYRWYSVSSHRLSVAEDRHEIELNGSGLSDDRFGGRIDALNRLLDEEEKWKKVIQKKAIQEKGKK